MAQDNKAPTTATPMTQDQRDQQAVDAMLPRLKPRGWALLKGYLQGCLDTAEELTQKGA